MQHAKPLGAKLGAFRRWVARIFLRPDVVEWPGRSLLGESKTISGGQRGGERRTG